MTMQMTIAKTVRIGDKSFVENKTITGDGGITLDVKPAAAKTGTLTSGAGTGTGVAALTAGHGLITNDVVDIYWTVGGVAGVRYGVTVTMTSNDAALAGGAGDNYPANASALTVMKQISDPFLFAGNNLQALVIYAAAKAVVQIKSAGAAELVQVFKEAGVYLWELGMITANPVTGDTIVTVLYSHGDSTAAREIRVGAIYN